MSTTSNVKLALKGILSDGKGRTHGELWKELIGIATLKVQLIKPNGIERKGVLSGIFTRVQQGKEEGFRIVKKDGKSVMVYSINKANTLLKLTDNYLQDVTSIKFSESELTDDNKKLIKGFQDACNTLANLKPDLKIIASSIDKNGTSLKTNTEDNHDAKMALIQVSEVNKSSNSQNKLDDNIELSTINKDNKSAKKDKSDSLKLKQTANKTTKSK
ncbi:hypothetical protein ACYSNU_07200 [Enterococcus sp. LJL120]